MSKLGQTLKNLLAPGLIAVGLALASAVTWVTISYHGSAPVSLLKTSTTTSFTPALAKVYEDDTATVFFDTTTLYLDLSGKRAIRQTALAIQLKAPAKFPGMDKPISLVSVFVALDCELKEYSPIAKLYFTQDEVNPVKTIILDAPQPKPFASSPYYGLVGAQVCALPLKSFEVLPSKPDFSHHA